ncbi:MAG: hypothetical protein H0U70_06015 [Tatlockia sp.]|nr:hypothetical protein [Tatlockia sp.]
MRKLTSTDKARIEARNKFLSFFPNGFIDEKYIAWERGYKWAAYLLWKKLLNENQFRSLLSQGKYEELAKLALHIESKTNLLFSFEKMAIRDALKTSQAAMQFSKGLYRLVYGKAKPCSRFNEFKEIVADLPRKQTRVLTWPVLTVFAFIADPKQFIFLKPKVTKIAAANYHFAFDYSSQPNWNSYQSLLNFSKQISNDLTDLKPKDHIDIQSFIWTLGSEEYS